MPFTCLHIAEYPQASDTRVALSRTVCDLFFCRHHNTNFFSLHSSLGHGNVCYLQQSCEWQRSHRHISTNTTNVVKGFRSWRICNKPLRLVGQAWRSKYGLLIISFIFYNYPELVLNWGLDYKTVEIHCCFGRPRRNDPPWIGFRFNLFI